MTDDELIAKLKPLEGCVLDGEPIRGVLLIPPELREKQYNSVVLEWYDDPQDPKDPFYGWLLDPKRVTRIVAVRIEGGVRLTFVLSDGRSKQCRVTGPTDKLAALVLNCTTN